MSRSPERQPDESTFEGKVQREAIKLAQGLEDALIKNKGKKEKNTKKKTKKSGASSERLSPEEYQETIIRINAQIIENVGLLVALADASEMAEAGDKEIQSIFDAYVEIVRLATEQEDVAMVKKTNELRSAVGRIISSIGEIKDEVVLKKITGEKLWQLFNGAVCGILSAVDVQAEIAKFTAPASAPEVKPSPEPVDASMGSPLAPIEAPVPALEPTQPPGKPEAQKPPAGEVTIDVSNPVNIPDFIRQLRAAKNTTIELPFTDGTFTAVKVSSLADIAQRHIKNLAGIAKNPERQVKEARGILKAAPKEFGYRAGLQKLFIDLKFIEDPQVKIAEKVRKDEAFRAGVAATTSFGELCDFLSKHPEGIKDGKRVMAVATLIEVLGEIERAAERKDGAPIPKSLMDIVPVDSLIQAKAAEFFAQINSPRIPDTVSPEGGESKLEPEAVGKSKPAKGKLMYSAKPQGRSIRVFPGMSGKDIVKQQMGEKIAVRDDGDDPDDAFLVGPPGSSKNKPGKKRVESAKKDATQLENVTVTKEKPRGVEITEALADRVESVAIEIAQKKEIEKMRTELYRLQMILNNLWFSVTDTGDQSLIAELNKIFPSVIVIDEEVKIFGDKSVREQFDAYTALLNKYTEVLNQFAPIREKLKSMKKVKAEPVAKEIVPPKKKETVRILMSPKPIPAVDTSVTSGKTPLEPVVSSIPEKQPTTGVPIEKVERVGDETRITFSPKVKAELEAKKAAAKAAEKASKEAEAEKKKKSEKAETPEQRRERELKTIELLEKRVVDLQKLFDEVSQKVSKILTDNPQDAEIQTKKPKEVVADIIIKLDGRPLQTKVALLEEAIITHENALREMEAILTQRQQTQGNQPGTPGTIPSSPSNIPPIPPQAGSPRATPQTPHPVRDWFKQKLGWKNVVAFVAAGATLFGAAKYGQNIEKRNREREEGRPTTGERASSPTGAQNRPENMVTPPVAFPRAPEAPTPARVENYPGMNFNEVLLRYPNALKSGWVFQLFNTVDRDLQQIQSPQDFDVFFRHYFGELNVGTYDFMNGRDIKENQQQRDRFYATKSGSEFDVKVEYKWLGAEDLKFRLALVTKLREVLVLSSARFANVPGADEVITNAYRLNRCALLGATLQRGLQKLDPLFDTSTITNDGAILDRLLEAQRARR